MDLGVLNMPHIITAVKTYLTKGDLINKFYIVLTFIVRPNLLNEWFEHDFANRSTSRSPQDDKISLVYAGILLVVAHAIIISDNGIGLLYWIYLSLFSSHVLL